ncbi:glyceraldehyde 3-phosphate reductase [Raoultella ornithinolytica]|jgi:L-glyceraldehyde 3-phosphate reductase|uniref:L-glyceraldehyde 3-phosphate reductase n=1 Tax=Raoultella ornithinolytica TaxID=54291 RepID=A0A1Y6GDY8_RAOOR|nr:MULTISPECIES: L-glyceraldehyde 3-phosphate reductase [Raoultella]HDX8329491.1 L-glyceraldehyde 3-phosphate reductase [Raoultella ornithinolytica CD1_MRS_4]AGJ89121.1 L-glyceraldehyde 3-phosphate reductase [Raoultella ornithinolytica B6]ALQ44808.1 putative oxidoreductase (related to aryl-alcohol dehydrogenase) [Raoultella ornithinolytica]ANZ07788.1 L-glyceraldehyde 3-phosphate reductase [Raoultella ornithinolytica]APB07645.1 L-glyceraldehyde 3-phosphate reductase [Raoultella ornithinolytica]
MSWLADATRYDCMQYRYCGKSGLQLPLLSLGLWHNFSHGHALDDQRALLRKAFDLGITHFDLANNYGPPPGSAEENFGRLLREDFAAYRDELIVATKAGYSMWPGPYGNGSSRKYLLASLDQSLQRMGLDYVDIFYSHRVDENTPMEETAAALAQAVQSGKALYVGISSYSPERTQQMAALLRDWKIPLLIHQPSYNLLNRWVDTSGLLDTLEENGVGCIAFTPLAQGLLTGKYLQQIPEGSRMFYEGKRARGLTENMLSESNLNSLRLLQEMAHSRGQSMAQMALSWLLKDRRVTSVLIGASRPQQLEENVQALKNLTFSAEELAQIDQHVADGQLNLWQTSSDK